MTGAMKLAISLAKRFGLPPTHRTLYVIELAIKTESEFRDIPIAEAAANIREGTLAEVTRGRKLNYSFFAYGGWRPVNQFQYSQADFDERDLRLMGQALRKLMTKDHPERRTMWEFLDEEGILQFQCEFAGISVERGRMLKRMQMEATRA